MTQAISATGLRGFLQWLQADQPAIYAATASKIAKAVPRGFSGFNGSKLTAMRLAQGRRSMRLRGYGLAGCCGLQSVTTCCGTPAPNVCIDVSCAANAGTTCATALTGVANIISATAGAVMSVQQQQAYDNLVSSQLSRASTGLSPLTLSSTAAGIPRVSGSSLGLTGSSGTLLLLGGGALLLYMLLSKRA